MNRGYLYAFLTALCWSTSGLFVKYINQSAFIIAGATSLIALMFNQAFVRKKMHFNKFVFFIAICQVFTHLTFILANQFTSVGNAIVLQYSSMIFVLVYESIDCHKLPKFYQIIVILLAITGMLIFFMDSFTSGGMLGNTFAVLSGASFGLQFYLNGKEKAHPYTSIQIQYLISITLMILLIFIKRSIGFTIQDVTFISLSGMIQTALAGLFFSKCIVMIKAFTANVICMSEIILAPIWAFILLGETFTKNSFLGALVMMFALLLNVCMEYKLKNKI